MKHADVITDLDKLNDAGVEALRILKAYDKLTRRRILASIVERHPRLQDMNLDIRDADAVARFDFWLLRHDLENIFISVFFEFDKEDFKNYLRNSVTVIEADLFQAVFQKMFVTRRCRSPYKSLFLVLQKLFDLLIPKTEETSAAVAA